MAVGREKFQWWVPLASLAVLGAMEAWKLTLPGAASGEAFLERNRQIVGAFGRTIDDGEGHKWEGMDIPLPQEAIKLLHANTFISRDYQLREGDKSWASSILFMEVEDSRDMVGHYPPNCYPASGWVLQSQVPAIWHVKGLAITGVEYVFKRSEHGRDDWKTVRDFFILPNNTFYPDIASFQRAASGFAIRHFGATQVQIIWDEQVSFGSKYLPEDREAIFQSLIKAHMPLIEAVSRKD